MTKARPDGSGQITGAWVLLLLGMLVSVVGIFRDVSTYPSIDLADLAAKWMMIYVGGAMITISFFLFLAGWIIRAIWFLPGRDDAVLVSNGLQPLGEDGEQPTILSEEPGRPMNFRTAFLIIGGMLLLLGVVVSYGEYKRQAVSTEYEAVGANTSNAIIENIIGN
ncbi:hypothetical protein SAMN02927924_01361 [Sphingobium faniae]|nr:hypothetical protein SAMN02927924_01361 [Sphingobium faniae]